MPDIEHVWFDFSDTIASADRTRRDAIKYSVFASMRQTEISDELKAEFEDLFERHGRSNSSVFVQEFGVDGSFWPNALAEATNDGLYTLVDPSIPKVLKDLSRLVTVSVFSNNDTMSAMDSLGIDTAIFTNVLSSAQLQFPKPHIEGYKKVIELSDLAPEKILYVADDEVKDIIPANSVGIQTGIVWNKSDLATYNFANFHEILELIETKQ